MHLLLQLLHFLASNFSTIYPQMKMKFDYSKVESIKEWNHLLNDFCRYLLLKTMKNKKMHSWTIQYWTQKCERKIYSHKFANSSKNDLILLSKISDANMIPYLENVYKYELMKSKVNNSWCTINCVVYQTFITYFFIYHLLSFSLPDAS